MNSPSRALARIASAAVSLALAAGAFAQSYGLGDQVLPRARGFPRSGFECGVSHGRGRLPRPHVADGDLSGKGAGTSLGVPKTLRTDPNLSASRQSGSVRSEIRNQD